MARKPLVLVIMAKNPTKTRSGITKKCRNVEKVPKCRKVVFLGVAEKCRKVVVWLAHCIQKKPGEPVPAHETRALSQDSTGYTGQWWGGVPGVWGVRGVVRP